MRGSAPGVGGRGTDERKRALSRRARCGAVNCGAHGGAPGDEMRAPLPHPSVAAAAAAADFSCWEADLRWHGGADA